MQVQSNAVTTKHKQPNSYGAAHGRKLRRRYPTAAPGLAAWCELQETVFRAHECVFLALQDGIRERALERPEREPKLGKTAPEIVLPIKALLVPMTLRGIVAAVGLK